MLPCVSEFPLQNGVLLWANSRERRCALENACLDGKRDLAVCCVTAVTKNGDGNVQSEAFQLDVVAVLSRLESLFRPVSYIPAVWSPLPQQLLSAT